MICTSSESSCDNEIQSISIDHYSTKRQSSSLAVTDSEKNIPTNITTANDHSSPTVNHLLIEEDEENIAAIKNSGMMQMKEQPLQKKTYTNINTKQITNHTDEEKAYDEMMSSDEELDNDSELIHTLAQLHGVVHMHRSSSDFNQNLNSRDASNTEGKLSSNYNLLSNSHKQEGDKNYMFSMDNDMDENQKQNYEQKNLTSSKCFSLSSLVSSGLLNDNESSSDDIMFDSDTSSSLITSMNELNKSTTSSNQFKTDDLQATCTNFNIYIDDTLVRTSSPDNHVTYCNDLLNQSVSNVTSSDVECSMHENIDDNDLINYLHWITSHLNDNYLFSIALKSENNAKLIVENEPINQAVREGFYPDLYFSNQCERDDMDQGQDPQENKTLSYLNIETESMNDEFNSNILPLEFDTTETSKQQVEQLVDEILSEAIDRTENEEKNLKIENLTTIIDSLNETNALNRQMLDPFDKAFDSIWTRNFQIPDDIMDDNSTDSLSFYTNTFEDASLFSIMSNQDNHIEESIILSLPQKNPFDSSSNLIRYSVFNSIRNNHNNDCTLLQDEFILNKVIFSILYFLDRFVLFQKFF